MKLNGNSDRDCELTLHGKNDFAEDLKFSWIQIWK